MKAIRGATTVSADNAEEVRESVKELLLEINSQNGLKMSDIICIMFSNTNDLHSFYPAKAAREVGFFSCALYSSIEPDIIGSLPKCIRVMVLAETLSQPKHVYLRGAKTLRSDISNVINVALDGPAGSGKSTVSKIVADKLNILCLDTGAMYRACALKCLRENVDIHNEKEINNIMDAIDISVNLDKGAQITILDGEDVSAEIREPKISMLASTVSAIGCVRKKMVDLQRKIAEKTSCILDGRDIGTNVLPDAKYKFYLTASVDVRAKRRFDELTLKGNIVTFDEIKEDIIRRDEQDKNRKIAPLMQAEDAVYIDSSDMSADEVASFIINSIQEKI